MYDPARLLELICSHISCLSLIYNGPWIKCRNFLALFVRFYRRWNRQMLQLVPSDILRSPASEPSLKERAKPAGSARSNVMVRSQDA
ncbi:hypothetical protein Forpi1262_v016139 [Fusarium oxysporum f. sp. raphani]|uniref:Uncharacterized protein n=1 Tax=Fusarium oxysporum f. sp. raphani TaxID=96318 RepID=A0A8J5UGM1_FUSOX|nr:hypothetical protein Forpi1262_v016139 [Fusarium oxysporum f. sp. raphani]